MKKITIFMLLVALLAIGVSAVQVSNPTVGGEKQDRVANVTSSFVITNNANQTMSGISVAFAADAKYALTVPSQNIPSSIAANSAVTVQFTATVPLTHPGVDSTTFLPVALKVGTLSVSGTLADSTVESASGDVNMQAVNQLEIKKVRLECTSKSDTLSDGDRVKNLKPGEDCTLTVEVESQFSENDKNGQKVGAVSFGTVSVDVESSNDDEIEVDTD